MKSNLLIRKRFLAWVGVTALVFGLGRVGYPYAMGSALSSGGALRLILSLSMGLACWAIILGLFQGGLLYLWVTNKRPLVLKWLGYTVLGWGFAGGILGGILTINAQLLYAFVWGGYEALLDDPPTWIMLFIGLASSGYLQEQMMREAFESHRQWQWSSFLGWGIGCIVFFSLGKWLPFNAWVNGVFSGLAAGVVVGLISGRMLLQWIAFDVERASEIQ